MSGAVVTLAFTALMLEPALGISAATHRREVELWQQQREARLRADGGWLTVTGLHWLKDGATTFGSDGKNDIVLPAHSAPARAGTFTLVRGQVTAECAPGVAATLAGKPVTRTALRTDAHNATPDVLALGALTMQIIDRGGRLGVRLKDSKSPARANFKGLRFFPVKPDYRVIARFVPHPKPVVLPIPNVLGNTEPLPSPGRVLFTLAGRELQLDPVIEVPGDTQLFYIFRDATSGKSTYGAGRFFYSDMPRDGQVVLDFNKAYSPPCAFTAFATCPLPPKQNRLPIAVEAGELFDGPHP